VTVAGFRADYWAGGNVFERSKAGGELSGTEFRRSNSSGGKQRLGAISKQGNPMMRSLLVEAGHHGGALRSRTENACINV